MTIDSKIKTLSAIFKNYKVADFSLDLTEGLTLVDLLYLSFYQENKQIAFRSTWLLETIVLKDRKLLTQDFNQEIISNLPQMNNWSCIRSYSKILMFLTKSKSNNFRISEQEEQTIIEVVFNWLIDPKCPIAVLVNCMDILNQMSIKHLWIKDELYAQILYIVKNNPTPAIKSRANRILKKNISNLDK